MDCYPEYHNHYQHYNNIHNTYFPSNNNPSMHRFGGAQLNNTESQPSPFYEGFSRHNIHHYSGQGSFSPSSSFDTNNESSQFYYANMHQQPTTSSYYGNPHQNTYDSYSYRNIPSNYRYHYGYHHHYPPAPPPQMQNHSTHPFYPFQHQQQHPYNSSNSSDHHFNHYQTPPTSVSSQQSHHHHHQQGEYNSPSNNIRSNDFSPSFNSTSLKTGQSSEKLLDKDLKHTDMSTINTTNVSKTNELDDKTNNTQNDQQVNVNVNLSSQESSSIAEKHNENSNAPKEMSKDEKAINNKNDENNTDGDEEEVAKKHKNESFNENENCKENQQHTQNEEATSATDYSPESSKVNKIPQENEKQQNVTPTSGISRLSEHHNLPNMNDRSSTPIIGYNNHSNISSHNYSHKRYPPMSWYSQHEYYNNWMMNPDDRRNFPDSQKFFSSMRSKSKNHNPDKHKLHDNPPSSTKRTKRKPKVEDSIPKVDPNKDIMKNVTPLPGFLQTFGQTEIGKFSEAFYTSDSPMHYYNNIESDIDSPQLDWDSLDGPIGNPMPMQVASSFYMYGSENEFDSPISSFNEIMCKDF